MAETGLESAAELARDSYLATWLDPKGLTGRIIKSPEELRKLFPDDGVFGEVSLSSIGIRETESTILYGLYTIPLEETEEERIVNVAYWCSNCDAIVLGPPEVKLIKGGIEGYCRNCEGKLMEREFLRD